MAFKEYYELTKPGIIYGNAITLIGGFFLASRGIMNGAGFNVALFFAALIGLSLVIASGCVFNNFIDRDIDAKMERTHGRALVAGRISGRNALIFGACLGLIGFFILLAWTNLIAAAVAFLGFFVYVFLYSMWSKRTTSWSTVVGSIAGATPPVVGYCAVTNQIDAGAIILFAILVLWQMPHFYSVGLYRRDDYAAASLPILPVRTSNTRTKATMLLYIIVFVPVALSLFFFGYAGVGYFLIAALVCLAWLAWSIHGFWASDEKRWARQMFLVSLTVIMALFVTMAVSAA